MKAEEPVDVEIVLDKEKLNDFTYINSKLLQSKLDILNQICENSDKTLSNLIKEMLPEIKAFSDADSYLERYNLKIESIFPPEDKLPNVKKINITSQKTENNPKRLKIKVRKAE